MNELDKQVLGESSDADMKMMEDDLMSQAMEADSVEEEAYNKVEGDFSVVALNKLVDSLNRVNLIFKAPEYPKFESATGILPPEFVKNLEMVNKAAKDSGLTDFAFDIWSAKGDKDLKMVAGKLDAAAGDKSFKAFLNKPMGMGEIQREMGMPTQQAMGEGRQMISGPPAGGEDELFMARMKTK